MPARRIQLVALLSMTLGAAAAAQAGGLVIVLRSGGTGWQFKFADRIFVNGKPKVRLGTAGKTEVRAEEYKKLTSEPVGQVPFRVHSSGYLVYRSGGGWAPLAPDGASIKGSASYASLWSAARMQAGTEKNSKGSEINTGEVFAILPGAEPTEAAADFLLDEANFTGVGEKDVTAAFEERMSLLAALAAASPTEGASAKLKALLLGAMEPAIVQANTGIAKYSDIETALIHAAVSERAFPGDPEQIKAREEVRGRKLWIDRRGAILKAFGAGQLWDPLIEKYGEFERFDNSFPELHKLLEKSLRESASQHLAEGKRLFGKNEFSPAIVEIKVALNRNPVDREALGMLEKLRLKDAEKRAGLVRQKKLDSTEIIQLNQYLSFAESHMAKHQLAEAEEALASAEAVDKEFPRTMLIRTKLLQTRQELAKALEMLDAYDRRVGPQPQGEGADLRNKIIFDLKASKADKSAEIAKAEATGDYSTALEAARFGMQLDPEDPEFLYHAGFDSAILRKEKDAVDILKHYLKASQSLTSDAKLRAAVYSALPVLSAKREDPEGKPNWFSGYNSESFYCPVSLMPNAKPAEVRASRKQTATYEWKNGLLLSVNTVNATPADAPPPKVFFDYFPGGKAVRRVGVEALPSENLPPPKLTTEGTTGSGKGTFFALFNHPTVNPYMVEKLTGKRVATIVAGNPYFHPFVWTGIHTFIAEYDDAGRIRSAREIHGKNGAAHMFAFEWQGKRLMAIVERGSGAAAGEYRREMHYAGDRLLGETVHYQGKNSKIDYKYEGDRLLEAICDSDFSIDGRSRRVSFLPQN